MWQWLAAAASSRSRSTRVPRQWEGDSVAVSATHRRLRMSEPKSVFADPPKTGVRKQDFPHRRLPNRSFPDVTAQSINHCQTERTRGLPSAVQNQPFQFPIQVATKLLFHDCANFVESSLKRNARCEQSLSMSSRCERPNHNHGVDRAGPALAYHS